MAAILRLFVMELSFFISWPKREMATTINHVEVKQMSIANSLNTDDFAIVIIPDTQKMAVNQLSFYKAMTSWIVDHAKEMNLKMILHLGDVVDHGANCEAEFQIAEEAFNTIYHADLPMLVAAGNHDYDNLIKEDRSLTLFNRYFGVHRYHTKPWFGGTFEAGQAENCFFKLEIAGRKFIFLSLEFGPRDQVLAWADEILTSHSDHLAIMITHCYMYIYGERTKTGDKHNPKSYPGAVEANDGEDLWNKSLRKHGNLVAVFSGHHIYGNVSYRVDKGDNDNLVFQSFQNWQGEENGGEGRFRILTFRPSTDEMTLQVMNPYTNEYETKDGYEIALHLDRGIKS
ncbi:metallophosphoesterase [Paenibacillus thalictri]|uniref:Calcineurin-like phosphoesterase domain-containing protein n=1 Tax=Paenibacillus thalictri TaxID=2527873 RepID=A0A4Q9DQ58_9BACL|nr:metallophosphoesterase [Paenibacillus thalictri]TBL78523.1 hypothetical protein EYB31_13530 [Paenibacillus thalictri]